MLHKAFYDTSWSHEASPQSSPSTSPRQQWMPWRHKGSAGLSAVKKLLQSLPRHQNRPPPSFTDLPDLVHSHVSSFLIINDVLRVSETCRALLNSYGCKLQHLTVAWRLRKARARAHPGHPTPSELQVPRDPSHLFSLLRRHPNLRRLDIRDADAIPTVTRALSSGLCRELQSLDLRVFSTTDAELQHLASSLESGALPNLISLAITCCTPLAWFGFIGLMRALASGCCTTLCEIKLDPLSVEHSDAYLSLLAQALEQRASLKCSPLTSLSLTRWSNRGDDSHASLRRLLMSPLCRRLERLHLDLSLSGRELHALSAYIGETGCPCLRSLRLTAVEGEKLHALAGLAHPNVAPKLEVIELLHADLHGEPVQHLSSWIEKGGWRSLRELRLQRAGLGKEDLTCLMASIRAGHGCPQLRILKVEGSEDLNDELMSLVAGAIAAGALPAFEELGIAMTGSGSKGVRALAAALLAGAPCARTIKRLDLRLCDIGYEGALSIAQALLVCPQIESLELGSTVDGVTGQSGATVLAEAFERGAGRHLKRLTLAGMGQGMEGSKAFIRAFKKGACPRLEEVVLLPLDSAGAAVRSALRAKRPCIIVNGYKAGCAKGRCHRWAECNVPAS